MSNRILLLFAIVLMLGGTGWMLVEHRASLEGDLELEAIRQLSLQQVMGVNPDFDGRDVTLKGKVESPEERQRAEQVVRGIEGVGEVTNTLDIGPRHTPVPLRYFLDVAWRAGGINVRGRVPDEATKALLLEKAAEDFGPELVTDRVQIDGSLGSGEWLTQIAPLLPELTGNVSPGRMKAAADKVVLAGVVSTESSRLGLEGKARQLVPSLRVENYLEVEEPDGEAGI